MSSQMAKWTATSCETSLAGMMPGESSRSKPSTRTHCTWRVTPALFSLLTLTLPPRRLRMADFPTFGYPITATRTLRGIIPRPALRSFMALPALRISLRRRSMPLPPFLPSTSTDGIWSVLPRYDSHMLTADLGAMSTLLSATTRLALRLRSQSSTRGCVVDAGMRASRTSTTTSTLLRTSCRRCSALAMCPGYHEMVAWPSLLRNCSATVSSSSSSFLPLFASLYR
mmetsp:Transcript_24803/g.60879  ORF Transcript_24803/g.60879 Transcript_24803/m.60879 type:complete len:227 (+) Transcript_24803:950-1630(+)